MRAVQTSMDLGQLTQRAITLLWRNRPADGYVGGFSGGKDSVVIKELARMADVPVEWHYHVTTIDPPELVRYIRDEHPDVIWDKPKHGNFFRRAEIKGFPTRVARWCCAEYKEAPPDLAGRTVVLGVRVDESASRAKHWTACSGEHFSGRGRYVAPIRLWSDAHVWEFIAWRRLPYCSLYDEGFDRLGCVGCPLQTAAQRMRAFARWPGFERQWRRLFERIWARRAGTVQRDGREWFGSALFCSHGEMFDWWNDGQPNVTEWLDARAAIRARREGGSYE